MSPTGGPSRFERALTKPRLPAILALAGVLLASPAVLSGWQVDDLFQRWILLKGGSWTGIAATPWDLFSFIDGDPERNGRLTDVGIFPWWTEPGLRIRFLRPLSVLTHRLDYLLWPASAPAMHLHSLGWFAAAIAGAALLYRGVLGVGVAAGLAAFFFAVDDAHGLPAGWIANRNALVGFVFGVAALRSRSGASPPRGSGSPPPRTCRGRRSCPPRSFFPSSRARSRSRHRCYRGRRPGWRPAKSSPGRISSSWTTRCRSSPPISSPFDTLFRQTQLLAPGKTIALSRLSVEIGPRRPDGRPDSAVFRFSVSLEDASLRWCRWSEGSLVPFTPPAVGTSLTLLSGPPFSP